MLGLGLSRLLPSLLREPAIEAGLALREMARARRDAGLARRLALEARPPFEGRRVALVGLFRARTGLSRAADLLARELEAGGAQVTRVDASGAVGREANVERGDVRALGDLASLPGHDLVLNLNPPEFMQVLRAIGPEALRGRSITAYWVWELDRVPPSWREALACAGRVWVPTRFVREAILATFPEAGASIDLLPHRTDLDPVQAPSAAERARARAMLGIEERDFAILTSFSMLSSMARKNPVGAIRAFRRAFPAGAGLQAILIVRCLDGAAHPAGLAEMRAAAAGDGRVRIVEEAGRDTSIEAYYHAADAYLSLHRGEGFGLNLAEALGLGLPVITTGWSLTDEIAGHPLMHAVPSTLIPVRDPQRVYARPPQGARWAEPDEAVAAALLRGLAEGRRGGAPPRP